MADGRVVPAAMAMDNGLITGEGTRRFTVLQGRAPTVVIVVSALVIYVFRKIKQAVYSAWS